MTDKGDNQVLGTLEQKLVAAAATVERQCPELESIGAAQAEPVSVRSSASAADRDCCGSDGVVIFDLDSTLWNGNATSLQWKGAGALTPQTRNAAGAVTEVVDQRGRTLSVFPATVAALRHAREVMKRTVAVASHAHAESRALELLRLFGLMQYIDHPSLIVLGPAATKVGHLETIKARWDAAHPERPGLKWADVMMVDDRWGILRPLEKKFPGLVVAKVPKEGCSVATLESGLRGAHQTKKQQSFMTHFLAGGKGGKGGGTPSSHEAKKRRVVVESGT
eukprot:m.471766 g.471766  ORF g.471766 m.471766 type:complete len:279 (+) comp31624_c0_seq1:111-947(+)